MIEKSIAQAGKNQGIRNLVNIGKPEKRASKYLRKYLINWSHLLARNTNAMQENE